MTNTIPPNTRLLALALLGAALLAAPAALAAAPNPIAAAVSQAQGPSWISWYVEATPEVGFVCCLDGMQPARSCKVEQRNQGWSTSGDNDRRVDPELRVLAKVNPDRVQGGKVERVVAYSRSCALELKSPVREIEVDARASLDFLRGVAREHGDGDGHHAIAAVAMHRDAYAGELLSAMSAAGQPRKLREEAIFWTGQTRGEPGVASLQALFAKEPDGEIREKILFSLSQTELESAYDTLEKAITDDRDDEVRGQACFWLAQSGADRAAAAIGRAIVRDPARESRKKCVFALSQLPDEAGTQALIDLVRTSKDREIRKEALFWLGQSDDPRALEVIAQLLQN